VVVVMIVGVELNEHRGGIRPIASTTPVTPPAPPPPPPPYSTTQQASTTSLPLLSPSKTLRPWQGCKPEDRRSSWSYTWKVKSSRSSRRRKWRRRRSGGGSHCGSADAKVRMHAFIDPPSSSLLLLPYSPEPPR